MKKINLINYKNYYIYFKVFNAYIVDNKIKKQALFDRKKISFSSYMRCSKVENKTTRKIYKILCDEFNMKYIDLKTLNLIEEKLNELYFEAYYKIDRDYSNDFIWLDELIDSKITIFPLLILFKLFILLNEKTPKEIVKKYKNLFDEIEKYKEFYIDEIKEIYLLLELVFRDESLIKYKSVCENELINQILATKFFVKGNYNTGLVYAQQAEKQFINSKNYIRAIMVNLTIMACYNESKLYGKTFNLAKQHYYSLKGFDKCEKELDLVKLHYVLSCIGLEKYKLALKMLLTKEAFNLNDAVSYIVIFKKMKENINWNELTSRIYKYKNLDEILDILKAFYADEGDIKEFIIQNNLSKVFLNLLS